MYLKYDTDDILDIEYYIDNSEHKDNKNNLDLNEIAEYIENTLNENDQINDLISKLKSEAFNQYMESAKK